MGSAHSVVLNEPCQKRLEFMVLFSMLLHFPLPRVMNDWTIEFSRTFEQYFPPLFNYFCSSFSYVVLTNWLYIIPLSQVWCLAARQLLDHLPSQRTCRTTLLFRTPYWPSTWTTSTYISLRDTGRQGSPPVGAQCLGRRPIVRPTNFGRRGCFSELIFSLLQTSTGASIQDSAQIPSPTTRWCYLAS